MHRINIGVDHEPDHLLLQALRVSGRRLGRLLISPTSPTSSLGPSFDPAEAASDLQGEGGQHRHQPRPLMAEMIYDVVSEPDMVAYAISKGAKGINLGGMCCTANEILMRHGIPTAGGFTNQELGILTGLVDLLTVDVQCIMPAITQVSKKFHTKIVTTNYRAKMQGAEHIEFDEHHAKDVARKIVKLAIDNYPNRTTKGQHITEKYPMIAGFSHEYIEYMQGGKWRGSFKPLNDAKAAGRVRGVVCLAG
jgi:carbon-monoxide dehydrogenase catalytic subunit